MRNDTVLVAVCAVDSELGTVQPIREIANILKDFPTCRFHVDATQAIGKVDFSFEGIDTACLTAHKFYGLNGSGILFKRKEVMIEPLIHGGVSITLYRSGTPALSLAASLDTALELALSELAERNQIVKMNTSQQTEHPRRASGTVVDCAVKYGYTRERESNKGGHHHDQLPRDPEAE